MHVQIRSFTGLPISFLVLDDSEPVDRLGVTEI